MNITQSYVSLFFWLGSCQLGLKVFHWERKFFLDFGCFQYFGGIHLLKFSITCVFVFVFGGFFCFVFFLLGDKHGWLISEISPWQDFCLKNDRLCFKKCAMKTLWEHFQERDIFLDPRLKLCWPWRVFLMDSVQPGTHAWSVFTPDFLILKEKNNEKNL